MRQGIPILIMLCGLHTTYAADWPNWRGPNHDGTTQETSGWNGKAWPIKEAWRTRVGLGGSSPIVADGFVYTLGNDGEKDMLVCIDPKSGKAQWRQTYACPPFGRHAVGDQSQYRGPSSTPTFDAKTGVLYTLSTDGDLNAWNTKAKGKRIWSLNLYESYDVGRRPQVTKRRNSLRDYGYTSAPFIDNDWLLVEVGDDEGTVMAFDKKTGKHIWSSQLKDPAGHTGGLTPIEVEGIPCVAVFTAYHVAVIRLDRGHEGKTLAKFPWRTDYINSIASLTAVGDELIVTSKYNQMRTVKLKVTSKGMQQVWECKIAASGVCSPVVLDKHVYFANRGLWCLSFADGELKMDGDRFGDAGSCIVTGDGRIIVWASNGDLVLIESMGRSGGEYKILGQKRKLFRYTAWPHVALADGRLYCKDRSGNMICFTIEK